MMEEEIKKVEGQEIVQGQPDQLEKPLEKMTAPELREIAMKLPGVTGVHAMKKGRAPGDHQGGQGHQGRDAAEKASPEDGEKFSTVGEVKKKISQLMQEKKAGPGIKRHKARRNPAQAHQSNEEAEQESEKGLKSRLTPSSTRRAMQA